MQKSRTRRLTTLAMLSALAYVLMLLIKIPVVMFLSYEPKDVIITIGGFLFGPLSAMAMSAVVSLVEMVTVSSTGIIGAVMNVLSTCAFACTAALIYRRNRTLYGAVIGLVAGCIAMTAVMLLWNYFLTPIYMQRPREEIAAMLTPVFLPFNLLKGGLNAAFTMLLYKPLKAALIRANVMPAPENTQQAGAKLNAGTIVISAFVIISCVLLILSMQGII